MKQVCQAFVGNPRRSASRNAIPLTMPDCTVCRILHEDLNFHPYKMVMVQTINDQDTVKRKTVWEVQLNALDNDDLNHVLMMDEGNFHLCGNVNSQNCHYWATQNPRDIHQKPLHSEKVEKVIVWCGVASFGVIGTYFFEDETGRAVTVNSPCYTWDASQISGTGVAETWCWNPDSLFSARWGNGSHSEDCNASPLRDVPSSHDLMKREYWMVCKIARSQCLWLLPLGISQEQVLRKNQGQQWT